MRKKRILVGMILFCFYVLFSGCERQEAAISIDQPADTGEDCVNDVLENTDEEKEQDNGEESIWIDIGGAVRRPGVYEMKKNSRVFEVVEAAGGFTENADSEWMNQAEVLADGEKIRVYTKDETGEMKEKGIQPGQSADIQKGMDGSSGDGSRGKVNLNTAGLEQLQEIPGIGAVRAQAILDYREETGRFQDIKEIQEVPGIKGKTFEKIEDYITVE